MIVDDEPDFDASAADWRAHARRLRDMRDGATPASARNLERLARIADARAAELEAVFEPAPAP